MAGSSQAICISAASLPFRRVTCAVCRSRFAPSSEGRKPLQKVMSSSGAHKPKPLAAGGTVGPRLDAFINLQGATACAVHFQRTKWRSEILHCSHAQEMSSLYCTLLDRIARKRNTITQTFPCMDVCWCLALPACSSLAVTVSSVLLHGHLLFLTGDTELHARTACPVHLTVNWCT